MRECGRQPLLEPGVDQHQQEHDREQDERVFPPPVAVQDDEQGADQQAAQDVGELHLPAIGAGGDRAAHLVDHEEDLADGLRGVLQLEMLAQRLGARYPVGLDLQRWQPALAAVLGGAARIAEEAPEHQDRVEAQKAGLVDQRQRVHRSLSHARARGSVLPKLRP
jgi:hypothetical protein